MKCSEIKSRLPCNLSLHRTCSNRRAYRQNILDTRVIHNLFMCFLHHIHPRIKTNLLESPSIFLLLEDVQNFYYSEYMYMYTTSIYT